MRRMMDKMGLDMSELPNVQEVIIKTDKKEIIITKPSVTEMKAKDSSIFTVTADSYEESELYFVNMWFGVEKKYEFLLTLLYYLKIKSLQLERLFYHVR